MTRDYSEYAPLPKGWRFVNVPEVSVEEQIEILERIERRAKDRIVQKDIQHTIAVIRNNGSLR